MLVYLSNFPFRALRWRRILREQKDFSLKGIMVPVMVGHMANNVLPARLGELYRAHFLGRRAEMSRSGAVGSIVVERTLDVMMLIITTALVFLLFPQTRFLGGPIVGIALIFLALAAGILFCVLAAERTNEMTYRVLGLLPKKIEGFFNSRLESFLRGIRGLTTIRGYLEAGGYTVVIWFLEAAAIALSIISFGVLLPLGGYFLVYALVVLGTTLPSAPGYVGPYQYAFVLALGVFSVSEGEALAISVVAHISLLGSITVIGLALLWREQLKSGIPLSAVRRSKLGKEKVG